MGALRRKANLEANKEFVPRLILVPVPNESVPGIELFITQAHLATRLLVKMCCPI
jgi:hypothetical protein